MCLVLLAIRTGLVSSKSRTKITNYRTEVFDVFRLYGYSHTAIVSTFIVITGSAVALPCINGDIQSQWEMANFDPLQNGNPFTDCQQK